MKEADAATRQRWTEDGFQYQCYQYAPQNLMWKGNSWRTPSALERERNMGFPDDHTAVFRQEADSDNVRSKLIGNAFHVNIVARLMKDLVGNEHTEHKPAPQPHRTSTLANEGPQSDNYTRQVQLSGQPDITANNEESCSSCSSSTLLRPVIASL